MSQRCRVFWDFYGPTAQQTAQHFVKHLDQLVHKDQLTQGVFASDVETYHQTHAAAYCDADYETGRKLAQTLKSKRSILLPPSSDS